MRAMRAGAFLYALLVALLLILLAGVAVFIWQDRRLTLERFRFQTDAASSAYAVHAGRNLAELRYAVDWLIERVDPEAPDYGIDAEDEQRARALTRHLEGLSTLLFVGADARVKFSTNEDAAIGADVSEREYFHAARDGKTAEFVGPAIRGKGSGRSVYTLSRRVERDGRFAGIAIASAVVGRWSGILTPLVPTPGSLLQLVRADRSLVVREYRDPESGLLMPLAEEQLEYVGGLAHPSAEHFILSRTSVPGSDLIAEVAVPREAALADFTQRRAWALGVAGVGLVGLLGFGVFAHSALRREAAATDALEAKSAELQNALESEKLLMAELVHRVKNLHAIVQALATRTEAASVEEFRTAFVGRLKALSRAHGALVETDWKSADLRSLLREVLEAQMLSEHHDRIRIDGAPVELSAQVATPMALMIHELATNATKYGALSKPSGHVAISWEMHEGKIVLTWEESDGPEVQGSWEPGFGMTLIERSAAQLGGSAEIRLNPTGLEWKIEVEMNEGKQ